MSEGDSVKTAVLHSEDLRAIGGSLEAFSLLAPERKLQKTREELRPSLLALFCEEPSLLKLANPEFVADELGRLGAELSGVMGMAEAMATIREMLETLARQSRDFSIPNVGPHAPIEKLLLLNLLRERRAGLINLYPLFEEETNTHN